jgi:hypothetical protein
MCTQIVWHHPAEAPAAPGALSTTVSTSSQGPEPDTCTRSQHGSYAHDSHAQHAAQEEMMVVEDDVLPPIGDECQLPFDFAQAYGITSIRVLTTSQAPAW